MAWLVGIAAVIAIVVFWRIFLPLGAFLAAAIVLIIFYTQYSGDRAKKQRQSEKASLTAEISKARETATRSGKSWEIVYNQDPASGKMIARRVYVFSDDGLCKLSVERRISGHKLTGIHCRLMKVSEYKDIDVKFDNLPISDKMDINKFSDGDDVYLTTSQYKNSRYLAYEEFERRLGTAGAVALKLPWEDGIWVTFGLSGFREAYVKLGTERGETGSSAITKPLAGPQTDNVSAKTEAYRLVPPKKVRTQRVLQPSGLF